MMGHKICCYGDMYLVITESSLLCLLILNTELWFAFAQGQTILVQCLPRIVAVSWMLHQCGHIV